MCKSQQLELPVRSHSWCGGFLWVYGLHGRIQSFSHGLTHQARSYMYLQPTLVVSVYIAYAPHGWVCRTVAIPPQIPPSYIARRRIINTCSIAMIVINVFNWVDFKTTMALWSTGVAIGWTPTDWWAATLSTGSSPCYACGHTSVVDQPHQGRDVR